MGRSERDLGAALFLCPQPERASEQHAVETARRRAIATLNKTTAQAGKGAAMNLFEAKGRKKKGRKHGKR